MGRKLQDLFQEAATLPDRERAELAGMLIETLDPEMEPDVEAAWAAEIERRVRQIESGEVKTIAWEQVRRELFSRIVDEG